MNDRADSGRASWAAFIRARRRELGLRQDELADLAGVSTRTISAVEAGKPTVRLDVLLAVFDTLGLQLAVSTPSGETAVVTSSGP
jgi:y4mF family transcriptional regulator